MDRQYALIKDGTVIEVITIIDGSPPIEERYHPHFIANMADITMLVPQPTVGWLFDWNTGRFAEALGTNLTPAITSMVAGDNVPLKPENHDPRKFFKNALVK